MCFNFLLTWNPTSFYELLFGLKNWEELLMSSKNPVHRAVLFYTYRRQTPLTWFWFIFSIQTAPPQPPLFVLKQPCLNLRTDDEHHKSGRQTCGFLYRNTYLWHIEDVKYMACSWFISSIHHIQIICKAYSVIPRYTLVVLILVITQHSRKQRNRVVVSLMLDRRKKKRKEEKLCQQKIYLQTCSHCRHDRWILDLHHLTILLSYSSSCPSSALQRKCAYEPSTKLHPKHKTFDKKFLETTNKNGVGNNGRNYKARILFFIPIIGGGLDGLVEVAMSSVFVSLRCPDQATVQGQ